MTGRGLTVWTVVALAGCVALAVGAVRYLSMRAAWR